MTTISNAFTRKLSTGGKTHKRRKNASNKEHRCESRDTGPSTAAFNYSAVVQNAKTGDNTRRRKKKIDENIPVSPHRVS